MLFALAVEHARLEVVVLMSGWNPHPGHPSMLTREHWMANNLYKWMPTVDVIHVNPGMFAFTYMLGLPAIVHFGKLMLPFGDGLNAPPSNEDIGRIVAGLVAEPDSRIGRCFRPTGPELISPTDAAEIMGKVLGRKVAYEDTSIKMFAKAAIALGAPVFEVANVRHYAAELAGGTFEIGAPSGHVEEVCGRPSEDFETIVRRYFADPDLIVRGLKTGRKLGAIRLLAKIATTSVPNLDEWETEHGTRRLAEPQFAHDNPSWVAAAGIDQLLLFDPPSIAQAPEPNLDHDRLTAATARSSR